MSLWIWFKDSSEWVKNENFLKDLHGWQRWDWYTVVMVMDVKLQTDSSENGDDQIEGLMKDAV